MTTFHSPTHPPGFPFNNSHEESMQTLGRLSPNYRNLQTYGTRKTSRSASNASNILFETESTRSPKSFGHSPQGSFLDDEQDGHSIQGSASTTSMMTPLENAERDQDLFDFDMAPNPSSFIQPGQQQFTQRNNNYHLVTPGMNLFNSGFLAQANSPPVPMMMHREQAWSPPLPSQYHLHSPQASQTAPSTEYFIPSPSAEPWSQYRPRNSQPCAQSTVLWAPDSDPTWPYPINRAHRNHVSQFSSNTTYNIPNVQHSMAGSISPSGIPSPSGNHITQFSDASYHDGPTPTQLGTVHLQDSMAMLNPTSFQYHDCAGSVHSPVSSLSEFDFESVTVTRSEAPTEFQVYEDRHMTTSLSASPASPTNIGTKPRNSRERRTKGNKSNRISKPSGSGQPATRGGRQLGSHMPADKAAQINIMRKVGTCWNCRFQRDKCDEGEPCRRCRNRAGRLGGDNVISCRRDPLRVLIQVYIPPCMNNLHNPETLSSMTNKSVLRWRRNEIQVAFSVGDGLPSVHTPVYQFDPKGHDNPILKQLQHLTDDHGNDVATMVNCPPLGLMGVHHFEEGAYLDRWVKDVIAHKEYRAAFVRKASSGEKDDFLKQLLRIFFAAPTPETSTEDRDLFTMRYLCIVAYVVAKSFCIELHQKDDTVAKLEGYGHITYPKYTCARLANRQLKVLFCQMLSSKLLSTLNNLQQTFTNSKSGENWGRSFVLLLGSSIAIESLQKYVHHSNIALERDGEIPKGQAALNSVSEVAAMDTEFRWTVHLFWGKYAKFTRENPLSHPGRDWSSQLKVEGVTTLLHALHRLILGKRCFLSNRIDFKPNHEMFRDYSGRLTGVFLLSFFRS